MASILKLIKNPAKAVHIFDKLGVSRIIPDGAYLKLKYRANFGKKLNLKNPKTFNEKLQWLKLYDRKPEYTAMVDKYEAKKYAAERIGDEFIIPTLGVWERVEDIDFDSLPNQFVLKCTHDSGGLVICRDKSQLNIEEAKEKLQKALKNNFYYLYREWPYKNVKPRIIAEEYMEDSSTGELRDYKFFCFDGVAKALFIATERQKDGEEVKFDFYNMNFEHLDFRQGHPNSTAEIKKPETFDKMWELAEKLSKSIPQLRVDFYEVNGRAYFGELTFFHHAGMMPFDPEEWDTAFGKWIKLPNGGGYALIAEGCVLYLHGNDVPNVISSKDQVIGLTDYKFYCFNGEPKFLYVSKGLEDHSSACISFLTMDWEFAPYERSDYKPYDELPQKPQQFDLMVEFARKLSMGTRFLRVDLYEINGQVYFSELTFFPCAGLMPFKNEQHDLDIGNMLDLHH